MKVEGKNTENGGTVFVEISDEQYHNLEPAIEVQTTRRQIESYIDNLDISADAKHLISSILDVTIRIGDKLVKLGQKIIEITLAIANQFPNTTFGLLLGILIGMLASSIPILGALLGPFVLPLAAVFGLSQGYLQDVRENRLQAKVSEAVESFSGLKGET